MISVVSTLCVDSKISPTPLGKAVKGIEGFSDQIAAAISQTALLACLANALKRVQGRCLKIGCCFQNYEKYSKMRRWPDRGTRQATTMHERHRQKAGMKPRRRR